QPSPRAVCGRYEAKGLGPARRLLQKLPPNKASLSRLQWSGLRFSERLDAVRSGIPERNGGSMGSEHLQNSDVNRGVEPSPLTRHPGTLSPTGGEGWGEGGRFMERFRRN